MPIGRKSWLFVGSERGVDRAAVMATLIMTAKLIDIEPLVWLADVLRRIARIPQSGLPGLLNWKMESLQAAASTICRKKTPRPCCTQRMLTLNQCAC